MIGTQKTGRLPGIVIARTAGKPLTLTIEGQPGVLAVLAADGSIVALGDDVARVLATVCVNFYRAMLKGEGHLRVWGEPIAGGVLISGVVHEGASVTIAGEPGSFAVLNESGEVVAAGSDVAAEVRSVAVNSYRDMLIAKGLLRVIQPPSLSRTLGGQSERGGAA